MPKGKPKKQFIVEVNTAKHDVDAGTIYVILKHNGIKSNVTLVK